MPRLPPFWSSGFPHRPVLALSIALSCGCGDVTVEIDAEARPEGGSGTDEADSSTGASPDTDLDETGMEPEEGSTTGAPTPEEPRCQLLDLLFVVDNTPSNAPLMDELSLATGPLVELLTGPSRPWRDDFHVGFVPTQSTGPLGECRVSGALSARPADSPKPCPTAEGRGWASSLDDQPATTLACLADLADASEQPRLIAQAAGRGLGTPIPQDPYGDQVVGQCNSGFHRADAMSVLVLVGSGDDLGSPGDASMWSPTLMADEESRLIVAMVPESDPGAECPGPAARLLEWLYHEPDATVLDWCDAGEEPTVRLLAEIESQLDARCEGGSR